MPDDTVIKVEHLFCLSGAEFLLHDISWEVRRGERWVIFGRNGCGKTTLLSVIAGYKTFSDGALEVLGAPYTAGNILETRKKIGWISSSYFDRYYTQETALDIVLSGLFGKLGVGYPVKNADVRRAKALLAEEGILDKMYMPFDLMSKGERQHVLIARAFIGDPEILILDEPNTGLDVLAREQLLEKLERMSDDRGITILYVTHYPEEIPPSFDRAMLLRNGMVYRTGATEELFRSNAMSDFLNCAADVRLTDGRFRFRQRKAGIPETGDGPYAHRAPGKGAEHR